MKTLDDDIRDAFAALDGTIPEGHFEELAARIDERLEVEAMGPEMSRETGDDSAPPPIGTGVETHDENSGLHDIKEMAQSTKKRISRRHSTQSETEESLLASASSASLSAIVLPEPGKDEEHYEIGDEAEASARPAAATARAGAEGERTGMPIWIYGAALAAVAAAAVIFFVTRGGSGDEAQTVAQADQAGEQAAESSAPAGADSPAPPAPPASDEPAPTAVGDEDGEGEETEGDLVAAADGEPADDSGDGDAEAAEDPSDDDRPRRRASKTRSARGSGAGSSGSTHSSKKKSDRKTGRKDSNAKAEKADKGTKTAGGKPSLEDLLDEAAGGAKSNEDLEAEKPDEPEKPAKTDLTRGEIKAGMSKVLARVSACYDKHKESGNVMISVVISPQGKVTKASPTGKFKNTETGLCVAQAVKRAIFPAWTGSPKRFNYPFLLSP